MKAKKSMALSAPPDKDPVMLLNEYGQKRGQLVSTNSGTYTSSRAFFYLVLNQGGEKEAVPKSLFTRREGYPCARVTLASGLKIALVYKQISQVGLPYHLGQLFCTCTCQLFLSQMHDLFSEFHLIMTRIS